MRGGEIFLVAALRSGRWQWFDLILPALAAGIVFPDKILDWCAERFSVSNDRKHVLILAAVSTFLLAVLTAYLLSTHARRFAWWMPIGYVGIGILFRALRAFLLRLLGLDEG